MSHAGLRDSIVQVGIVHSLSGTLAISEVPLRDAALMAIAEINQDGGVLGRQIVPLIEDTVSSASLFEQKVRKLLQTQSVATLFGGWLSAGRKLAVPLLEESNALLWYPVQYEGLEQSPAIFYTGACPNQQVKPAVQWLLGHRGKRFYLLGMDYVFPRVCNKITKAQLKHHGGTVVGETYPPLGTNDFSYIIEDIRQLKPDVVFSTLNGDSNLVFYQQYRAAGITADDIPVMGMSVSEQELFSVGDAAAGHYAAASYFQSIETPRNQQFVRHFQSRYGGDRVTSDSIESAYSQVYLWKQAVEAAQSFDTQAVREAAYGQVLMAPGGLIRIERNQHLWKDFYIGQIQPNGQFRIVAQSEQLVRPQPWLGVEDAVLEDMGLVIDLLGDVPTSIQSTCQLEQKSRELQLAMAELMATNAELQRTQAQLKEAAKREDLLKRRLSSQIRTSLELDTILNTAVHEIRNLLNIDCCKFIWCHHVEGQALTFAQARVAYTTRINRLRSTPAMTTDFGRTILGAKLLRVQDVATAADVSTACRTVLLNAGIRSVLAIAIDTHTSHVGLVVCEHGIPRPWSDSETELLEDVADQLAIAIEQAKLYEQSRVTALQAQAQAQELEQTLTKLQQTQAQLIQTEKMSGLGQLVAGVAHEINNPVNFIYGNLHYVTEYTENLLHLIGLYQTLYPDPATEIETYIRKIELDFLLTDFPKILASIQLGAERIRQIVLSLRNFSRLDESEMKSVDIHEGLNSTLMILQHRLKSKPGYPTIHIVQEYGEIPLVECYAGQLNQVFMNILSNAIDALTEQAEAAPKVYPSWLCGSGAGLQPVIPPTDAERAHTPLAHCDRMPDPEPPATPTIWVRTEVPRPGYVLIRIADNGPGMTEETKTRLFDPFFTTKPVGQGTGLGLSISYQIIVERHKGSIQCISHLGKGTEFYLEIPIHQHKSPGDPNEL